MINVSTNVGTVIQVVLFLTFFISMVIVCFLTVDKIAKIQQNVSTNIANGTIARNDQGVLYYNYQYVPATAVQPENSVTQTVVSGEQPTNTISSVPENQSVSEPVITQVTDAPASSPVQKELLFCPICGRPARGLNYCGRCGFKLK